MPLSDLLLYHTTCHLFLHPALLTQTFLCISFPHSSPPDHLGNFFSTTAHLQPFCAWQYTSFRLTSFFLPKKQWPKPNCTSNTFSGLSVPQSSEKSPRLEILLLLLRPRTACRAVFQVTTFKIKFWTSTLRGHKETQRQSGQVHSANTPFLLQVSSITCTHLLSSAEVLSNEKSI